MAHTQGDVFERVLIDFKSGLTPEERTQFSETTLQQLQARIMIIQKEQASTRTMQNMGRIKGFLEAMENYSKVLDLFTNVSDFVAFIWITSSFAEAFNALLDAYQRIFEVLPVLEQYQALLQGDLMRQALETTFKDIFEFHRLALKYFGGKVWKQLFQATWKTFNSKFGSILDNLRRHKELVATHATLKEFQNAREARQLVIDSFMAQSEQHHLMRKYHVLNWLSAPDVSIDQERGEAARDGQHQSGRWMFRHNTFRSWYDLRTGSSSTLWIHGKPGAGKSVLASLVVEEALKHASSTVLYFYCRYQDSERNTFVALARAFLKELVQKDSTLVDYLYESSVSRGEVNLKTRKLAMELLGTCLKAVGKMYIIVDGLDECDTSEQKNIATWLSKHVDASTNDSEPTRCLFLSQDDSSMRSILAKGPELAITSQDTTTDIEEYCIRRAKYVQSKLKISDDARTLVVSQTTQRADGMFLFARLVMDNLSNQTNLDEFQKEMNPGVFPDGLDEAYARIMDRILGSAPKPQRRDASKLLAWLTCALRSLKWREIQTAFSINGDNQTVNLVTGTRRLSAKELCGAMVEEGRDGQIDFVHSTAKHYLMKAGYVQESVEHMNLAMLCLEYYSIGHLFETQLDGSAIDQNIKQGCYGFLDYAIISWTGHLEHALSKSPALAVPAELEETLEAFFELHGQTPIQKTKVPKALVQIAKVLRGMSPIVHEKTMATLACMHVLISGNVSDYASYFTVDIFQVMDLVRERMEALSNSTTDPDLHTQLDRFYGNRRYKCSRLYCRSFHDGFSSAVERNAHLEKHERSHYCPESGCHMAVLGIATKKELESHMASYHSSPGLRQEFPSGPATDDDANDEPERDPSRFYCDLCNKSFTRKSNLSAHSRSHNREIAGQDVYACRVCGKTFGRRVHRERHEEIHSGQRRKFICQGTLQSGVSWGCAKNFARADLLARHFRTAAGAACMAPVRDEEQQHKQTASSTAGASTPVPSAPQHIPLQCLEPDALATPPTVRAEGEVFDHVFPDEILHQFPELANIDWEDLQLAPIVA